MPYKPTGRPTGRPKTKEYVSLMARMPADFAETVKRYSAEHDVSVSELIRQGLEMRLSRSTDSLTVTQEDIHNNGGHTVRQEDIPEQDTLPVLRKAIQNNACLTVRQKEIPVAEIMTPEIPTGPQRTIPGTDIPYDAFDPSKHFMGKPCKYDHVSHGDAGNLWYIKGKTCWTCKTLRNRARRTVKAS